MSEDRVENDRAGANRFSGRGSSVTQLGLLAGWLVVSATIVRGDGLVFDKEFVSLGQVEVAGDLIQEFPFRVEGNSPIQILDVKSSCGCITPTLGKRVYQPGEKDKLVFGIHAASQTEGKKRFQVSISYRQTGDIVTIPIFIDVELFKPIAVEPSTLMVHVSGSRPFRQLVTVKDQRGQPLGDIDLATSSQKVKARILPADGKDATLRRMEVEISTDFPMGKTDERILVRVQANPPAEIVVPISIVRASRIKVLPEVLHAKGTGKSPTWQVLVSDARGEPIRIDHVEGPGELIKVSYPSEPTRACRLQVRVDPSALADKIDEEITVHVAEPIATKLILPVRVD
jgi:hypothetical protein